MSMVMNEEIKRSTARRKSALVLEIGQYRFNRRFRLAGMLPRLVRAITLYKPCAEPNLRLACNFHD